MLKPVTVAAMFAVPVVALSACTPNEPVATTPGTTPSVWTGSPSPSAPPGEEEGGHGAAAASGEKLTAQLKLADGTTVATADFEFANGYATVTVQTTAPGELAPGFHGLHVHSVGKCEANSVAPTGVRPPTSIPPAGISRFPATAGTPRAVT